MPYLNVQNFKFGVDSRRSELTSSPGTLLQADNGHVNQGGEFEKRKAFVGLDCTVGSVVAGTLPKGTGYCFGIEAGTTTFYTFGSAASGTVGALPTGVVYVRCQSPQGGAMTGIVSSTVFNSLPFCVAVFTDGTYAFYNGTLVRDFTAGVILANLNTNAKIGTDFSTLFSVNGYMAVDLGTGSVEVFNAPNAQATGYTPSVVLESAAGTLTPNFTSAGTPAVVLGASVAQFEIFAGTAVPGTNQIQSVKVFGLPTTTVSRARSTTTVTLVVGSTTGMTTGDLIRVTGFADITFNVASAAVTIVNGTTLTYTVATSGTVATTPDTAGTVMDLSVGVEILNVAVDWVTDNAHTAQNVAAQINVFTSSPDYVATSSGGVVSVFTKSVNAGAFNGLVIQITANGNVCVGSCIFSVTASGATITTTSDVFQHIIVNGIDIEPASATGVITDIPTALVGAAAYINSKTGTGVLPLSASNTGILAWSGVATGSSTGLNVLRLAKKITRSDDAPLTVNVTPVSGYGIATGNDNPLLASITPTQIAAAFISTNSATQTATTNLATCTPSGGVPPYKHSWTGSSSGSFNPGGINNPNPKPISINVSNANAATPTFTATYAGPANSGTVVGQYVDTVTDADGNVVTSNQVTIIFG